MSPKPEHLGGNRWRIRWWEPARADGSRRQRSRNFTATGKRDAEKQARHILAQIETERDERERIRGTVRELLDDWYEVRERVCSPTTLPGYRRRANTIVARFGDQRVADLSGRDFDRWFSELAAAGVSEAEQVHLWRVLRAALRFGSRKRRYGVLPALVEVTPPTHRPPEVEPPPVDVVARAIDYTRGTDWGLAFEMAARTGARRGEVLGMQWDDITTWTVEYDDGSIGIGGEWRVRRSVYVTGRQVGWKDPKTIRSRRTIDLDGDLLLRLDDRKRASGSVWVFPDPADPRQPRNPDWLSRAWALTRRRVPGAERVRLHDLRHWFATQALQRGHSVAVVSGVLGHADSSTTLRIYAHASRSARADAVASVGELLPAPVPPGE